MGFTFAKADARNRSYFLGGLLLLAGALGTAPASIAVPVAPSQGLWLVVGEPGSGIALDLQGETLVATIYTYDAAGHARWYIGSGKLEDGSLSTTLYEMEAGSCLNCPYQAASILDNSKTLDLRFVGSELGWISLDGGAEKAIRTFRFGREVFTVLPSHEDYGHITVSDLSGRWVFVSASAEIDFTKVYDVFCCAFVDPGYTADGAILAFFEEEGSDFEHLLACVGYNEFLDEPKVLPFCELRDLSETGYEVILSFYLGDAGMSRIVAYLGEPVDADSETPRGEHLIHGFRIPE